MGEWKLQQKVIQWTVGEEQDSVMRVVELATWQTTATTMLSEALLALTTTATGSITQ